MDSELDRIEADAAWWRSIAEVLGGQLSGFTYRRSATILFDDGSFVSLDGRTADTIARLTAANERMGEALRPFAAFADPHGRVPDDMNITLGSRFAKRQITMGDCYAARTALTDTPNEGETT